MNPPVMVSSEFCLDCRGCCVFNAPNSAWRACLTAEEEIVLEKRLPGVSFGGRLVSVPAGSGREACSCLNIVDHHCRAYDARPLECSLYPFLLSAQNGRLDLYAHLACPFVRALRQTAGWAEQVTKLQEFLLSPSNHPLLKAAAASYPDYSLFCDEVEHVWQLPFGLEAWFFERKSELESWYKSRKAVLSANSLVSAFAWSDAFDFDIEECDGNVLVFARQRGAEFLYCPPLGPVISPRAVERAFARMKGGAARIEAVAEADLACFDSARYRAVEQGAEYYYERARIAALAGNGYRSKRSDYNAFHKRHRPLFRRFVPGDAPACAELFDRWLDKRRASYEDDIYRAMLVENRVVHRRMIAHAAWLGLSGRVVEVAGRMVGYTFGYPLNPETFCVALEVTAPEFKGLAAYIFREFCADTELAPYKYINAMDDFGMPGVAKAKRSWRPAFLEKVYAVCLKP
ncbi:MAG: DUF2156 domain-containing protein [Candidatus Omnitrophica bacterium]|nr:DUF2156 domain-containing protein [Candidatus Omnitrophota bacterium]